MVTDAAIFEGTLRHRRFAPVAHEFHYRTAMAWLDIARLPELMAVSRLAGYNRFGGVSFHDADHQDAPPGRLRARLADDAARHGLRLPDGPVLLLTHLRHLGYVFNPVSFYYCFDAGARVRLVLAEVSNTFGGRHNYWLAPQDGGDTVRAVAAKRLYVSPFMATALDYRFALTRPSERLAVHIDVEADGRTLFDASLSLSRRPWSAAEIRRQLWRRPAATAAVVGRIHWQALRLWWKGVPLIPRATPDGRPAPPTGATLDPHP